MRFKRNGLVEWSIYSSQTLHFLFGECANFFDTLLPSGSGKGKTQSGANCLTPEVQGGPKDGAGLRSLTRLHCKSGNSSDDEDEDYDESESDDDDADEDAMHFSNLASNFKTLGYLDTK